MLPSSMVVFFQQPFFTKARFKLSQNFQRFFLHWFPFFFFHAPPSGCLSFWNAQGIYFLTLLPWNSVVSLFLASACFPSRHTSNNRPPAPFLLDYDPEDFFQHVPKFFFLPDPPPLTGLLGFALDIMVGLCCSFGSFLHYLSQVVNPPIPSKNTASPLLGTLFFFCQAFSPLQKQASFG